MTTRKPQTWGKRRISREDYYPILLEKVRNPNGIVAKLERLRRHIAQLERRG